MLRFPQNIFGKEMQKSFFINNPQSIYLDIK